MPRSPPRSSSRGSTSPGRGQAGPPRPCREARPAVRRPPSYSETGAGARASLPSSLLSAPENDLPRRPFFSSGARLGAGLTPSLVKCSRAVVAPSRRERAAQGRGGPFERGELEELLENCSGWFSASVPLLAGLKMGVLCRCSCPCSRSCSSLAALAA